MLESGSGHLKAYPSDSAKTTIVAPEPYLLLIGYKQWADRGLYDVVGRALDKLDDGDAAIMLRILDHILVVDRIFQHHLQGLPHKFGAPRSDEVPDFTTLLKGARDVDDWYTMYVGSLPKQAFDQSIEFTFTSGKPARMKRGEIILHVCLHGTYHRGNAGIVLQKNGIAPGSDAVTDFLESLA